MNFVRILPFFILAFAVSFNQCNGWLGIGKGSYPEKGFHKIYQMDLHQVHDEQKRMLKETDHMLTRVRKYLGEKNGKIPSKLREKANRALMEMKKSLKVYKIKLSVKPLQGATGRKILVDIHETLENFHHTLDKIAASTDPNYSKIKYRLRYLKQKIKRKLAKAYDKTKKVAVGAGWRTMGFEDDDDDPEEYTDIYLRPHRHIAHYAKTGQKAPPDLIVEPQRMPYQGPVNHLPEPTIAQSAAPAMALMPVQSTNGVMMIPIHSGMLLGKNGAFTSVPASDQEKKGDEEKKSDDDKQSHQLVSSEHLKKLTQATQSNQGDSNNPISNQNTGNVVPAIVPIVLAPLHSSIMSAYPTNNINYSVDQRKPFNKPPAQSRTDKPITGFEEDDLDDELPIIEFPESYAG